MESCNISKPKEGILEKTLIVIDVYLIFRDWKRGEKPYSSLYRF